MLPQGRVEQGIKMRNKDKEIFYSVVPEDLLISVRTLLMKKVAAIKDKDLEQVEQYERFWLFNREFIHFMVENR